MAVAPVTILPGNVANNNETPLTAGFLLCSVLPAVRVSAVHTNICYSVTLKLQLLYRLHFEILRKQTQIENPKGYSRAVNMDSNIDIDQEVLTQCRQLFVHELAQALPLPGLRIAAAEY